MNFIPIFLVTIGGFVVIFSENSFNLDPQKLQNDVLLSLNSTDPYSIPQRRFERATQDDVLTTSVNRLQMVARVTNGVYLQQGLIADTISSDELISDLLHFGPVTPARISAMNVPNVQKAINVMKEFPSKLYKDKDIEEAETYFLTIQELMEKIDGIGNIDDWNGIDDFKEEIGKLAANGVDMTLFKNMLAELNHWGSRYSSLEQLGPASTDTDRSYRLSDLLKTVETLKSLMSSTKTAIPVWKFEKINSTSDGISVITNAAEGASLYIKQKIIFLTYSKTVFNIYADYFKKLPYQDIVETGVQSSITDVNTLLNYRQMAEQVRQLQYTNGLPGGASDVSTLLDDPNDSWMMSVLKNDKLSKAFGQFKSIENLLKDVHNSLDPVKLVKQFAQFYLHFDIFAKTFSTSDNVGNTMASVGNCQTPPADDLKHFQPDLLKHLTEIDGKIAKMESLTAELINLLESDGLMKSFGDLVDICKNATNGGNLKESVQQFQDYVTQKNLNAQIAKINGILTNIQQVQQPTTIKADAEAMQKLFPVLGKHHTELMRFSAYFTCLQNQKSLDSVFNAVSQIQLYRGLKDDQKYLDSLDNGMNVVKKVVGTKDDLNKIKASMDGMKGFKSEETDGLVALKDPGTHSSVIGSAVQGVSNMKNALDKKDDVNAIVEHEVLIQKTLDGFRQQLVAEDVTNLEDVVALGKGVGKMYSTLDAFKSGVKEVNSTVLAEHSGVFDTAKTVTEVRGNLPAMSVSVGKLMDLMPDGNEKKSLEKVQMALKTMGTMGLEFSKFTKSFDQSKKSLTAMDLFFASYAKKTVSKVTKPPSQGAKVTMEAPETWEIKKRPRPTTEEPGSNGLKIAGIVVGSLCGLGLAGWLIYRGHQFYKKRKEDKKKPRPLEKDPFIPPKPMTDKTALAFIKESYDMIKAYASSTNPDEDVETSDYRSFFTDAYNLDSASTTLEVSQLVLKFEKYQRYNMPLVEETRFIGYYEDYGDAYYHGNHVVLPNQLRVFCGQGPQEKSLNKRSTMNVFLSILHKNQCDPVIMLCPWKENDDVIQSDRFFPERGGEMITIGNYDVQTIEQYVDFDRTVIVTLLQINIAGNYENGYRLTHYQYLDWPDKGVPRSPETVNVLIELMNKGKDPFVYCSDGCGRTGTFLFISLGYQILCNTETLDYRSALRNLRSKRAMAVSTGLQYGFCGYAILKKSLEQFDLLSKAMTTKANYLINGYENWAGHEMGEEYWSELDHYIRIATKGLSKKKPDPEPYRAIKPSTAPPKKTIPSDVPPTKKKAERREDTPKKQTKDKKK